MNRQPRPTGRQRTTRPAVAALALALPLLLTACGGGGGGATGPATSSGGTSPQVTAAKAAVAEAMKPTTTFDVPTESIDASSLKGKTIYYVPITIQAESFQITSAAMKQALSPLGISLQVCDGGASPDKAAACVSQATGAHAAAIVADAIPYGLAANAFDAAKAAGIPILISNQPAPSGTTNSDALAYALGNPVQMAKTAANWLIADSNGTANTVVNEYTDSPDTKGYMEKDALPILKACSGCTTVVNQVASANFALIPSSTSSVLLKNPDAKYFYLQYDTGLQPTMAGVQQANRLTDIKGVSTNGLLGAVQSLKEKRFLYADVASDYNFAAYGLADIAMRMALKKPVPDDLTVPIRLITRDNVGDLGALTSEAEGSGEWFGETTYKDAFAKLWGAS